MLIDWFTVSAQAVNFMILVWLLHRFLYKPVLAAIDTREKLIALAVADAASQKLAAERERAALAAKEGVLESRRLELLGKATSAAEEERQRLLAQARAESVALRAQQQARLEESRAKLAQDIAALARREVLAISRKVLGDLADASVEERMAELLARRLHDLSAEARRALGEVVGAATEVTVRSAFDVPGKQRAVIQAAVDEALSRSIALRFENSPNTLCGIELQAGGRKVGWNIADYLSALDDKLAAVIEAQRASNPPAMPAAPEAAQPR
jgi:F-type H+-transporting ATPase subunit b